MSHDCPRAANITDVSRLRATRRVHLLGAAAVAILLGAAPRAGATDYYLSPDGRDSNSGRDAEHPWKTWRPVENRTVLAPGNRVRLLDGMYSNDEAGFLAVDCDGSTGRSGTEKSPVTIEAVHERRAFLKGDGSGRVLWLRHCSFYVLQGLRVESADSPRFKSAHGAVEVSGTESSPVTGIVLRRNVVAHNNRYANSHLIQLEHAKGAVVEENEFYYFHRHALLLFHSDSAVVRRNYANSRGYPEIEGGRPSEGGGDESFSCYPCSDGTFENNISEGSEQGYTVNAAGTGVRNRYFGNVSLNESEGFRPNARGDAGERMPKDNLYVHNAAIGVRSIGIHNRSTKSTTVRHLSIFTAEARAQGLEADTYTTGHRGDGEYSFSYGDSVAVAAPAGAYGVKIESPAGYGRMDWKIDHVWAFGFAANFTPALGDARITNSAARDPGFGPCRLWCPDGAACKGAASDGEDLGATILYRYENGVRTTEPLWDPKTGTFRAAGAIVAELNDVEGASLSDVHVRLNVNRNGCAFPASYPGGSGAPASAPAATPTPERKSTN